jgi:hypothetical protein
MGRGLLCGQVAFEGVAYIPLFVRFGLRLASVGHLEGSVAGSIKPKEEVIKEMVCDWYGMDSGVFEGVVDEGVLLEERVGEGGDFALLNLAVPLLQDIDEEVELVVRGEKGMGVEFAQLEAGVLLLEEEFGYFGLDRLAGVFEEYVLEGCAYGGLFHSK